MFAYLEDHYLRLNNIWWQVYRRHVGNKHDTIHVTPYILVLTVMMNSKLYIKHTLFNTPNNSLQ